MGSIKPPLQHNPSLDIDVLPEIDGESELMRLEEIHFLSTNFPARIIGSDWKLAYTTSKQGFSLSNVYRHFQNERSPTLLVIMDTGGSVFGALISEPIRLDEHFYGTGESFLFTLRPCKKIFNWTGENQLFVQGTSDALIIGAGEGHFGLYIDSNIYKGRTQPCATYRNSALCPHEDFVIKSLECWTFC